MSDGQIRRAQLIQPFGVGAMSVLVDGTSVISCGLDHWFESASGSTLELNEFEAPVEDWRLQERLHVRRLRLPPDFRSRGSSGDSTNTRLTVPVLRFPRWSFCAFCKRLKQFPLSLAERPRCDNKAKHTKWKYPPFLSQVPFVAICDRGHLSDFPFREWVHRSVDPGCKGELRLEARGGGSLAGQFVTCETCGESRSLANVLSSTGAAGIDRKTHLTDQLQPGNPFECVGERPWLGDSRNGCGEPIRGALRGAGNVYFPKVESSIYLPRNTNGVRAEVLEALNLVEVRTIRGILDDLGLLSVETLRSKVTLELLQPFSDDELAAGIAELRRGPSEELDESANDEVLSDVTVWRLPEHKALVSSTEHPDLFVKDPGIHPSLESYFSKVRRIDVLRETRALRGFTRVSDGPLRLSTGKDLLRLTRLSHDHDWLPAYVVRGEGIFVELNLERLRDWESNPSVKARADVLSQAFVAAAARRGFEERVLTPRFVLIHTLAHVLINQLIYTCGYSSASLRERLYVSSQNDAEMAGLLIYTAAGDSEGTMGGLVRMSEPANFGATTAAAIDAARWCGGDPVCMELGEAGQGPDSCNLSACHACALLPETSCEEFNRFLDRALLIGTFDNAAIGFFNGYGGT